MKTGASPKLSLFSAETAAYRIAVEHPRLRFHVPSYFGQACITEVTALGRAWWERSRDCTGRMRHRMSGLAAAIPTRHFLQALAEGLAPLLAACGLPETPGTLPYCAFARTVADRALMWA